MQLSSRWRKEKTRSLGSYRIFELREDFYSLPRSHQPASFYVLETPDWVNVIPLTDRGEVVLIRQFRFGIEETSLEIPGGIVDPGLTPLAAGQKELLEETGYTSDQWEYLGFVHPNPAFLNNRCHTFVARGVKRTADPAPEEDEEFEIVQVPFDRIREWIGKGEITHSLVICAFHLYGLP